MIERYTLPEMGAIWSQQNKFQKWLDVEIAVCEVHAEDGTIPREAVEEIKAKAAFTVERINEIEKTTDHDVIAFTTNLAENIGEAARFVHYGLTSSDVVDTANAIAIEGIVRRSAGKDRRDAAGAETAGVSNSRTRRRSDGRTAFTPSRLRSGWSGLCGIRKCSGIASGLKRAKEAVSVGKISGAVGAFAHLSPDVEERVCAKLGLKAADVSTQVIQRDRYAEYLSTLAIIASTLEKIALQVRHWQRTEVREAQEAFKKGQKGSSAMPHKRNPILSERICGMARTVRANSIVGLENVALWHERDISHSSAERIVLPDSSATLDYMLAKTTSLLDTLVVYPENMLKNLNLTRGLVFSGQLMLALTQKGVSREDAYVYTQRNAMKVWDEGGDYKELIMKDADISSHLSDEEIARVFDLKHYLRNVDRVFARVFKQDAAAV